MEVELYSKATLDNVFQSEPATLIKLREHRILEPFHESPDYDGKVIPGDRRDLMALPGQCVSGDASAAWYYDLGEEGDNGAIYIGSQLFHHIANLVGYTPAEELRKANARVEELEKELVRIRGILSGVRIVRNELGTVQASLDEDEPTVVGPVATGGRPVKATGGKSAA